MHVKQMFILITWVVLLTGTAFTVSAETDVIKPTDQTSTYTSVNPQVSFKDVTELVTKPADQKVKYGDDPLQYGLLWQPTSQKTSKPLIVLVHGGCWLNAFGIDHSFAMATALAQAGHPVWSLEYRRFGDEGGGWPGSLDDIKRALQQLNILNQFQVKTDQAILIGHSAGGHLALLAAIETDVTAFKKIIGLAAITDISRYALGQNSCQQATAQFMAGYPHERPTEYHRANLIYRVMPKHVILLQGDEDRIVPHLQSHLYETASLLVPEAGHFDWIHPGSPAFEKLLAVLQ